MSEAHLTHDHHALESEGIASGWIEIAATILIAVAAVLTAWAAFQHSHWSGDQASSSRLSIANATAASQATTLASMDREIDVGSFLQWLSAVNDDMNLGRVNIANGYVPDPGTLSGFIALRFRQEFKPAFDAWIASRPLTNPRAAPTPFQLPEYSVAANADAQRLAQEAQAQGAMAHTAIERGENYALVTVLFAVGLVLASVVSKVRHPTVGLFTLGLAFLIVAGTAVVMLTFPVEI